MVDPTNDRGEPEELNQGAPAWRETDSAVFLDFGRIFTPNRPDIAVALLDLVPAVPDEAFQAVDVAAGQGWLSAALLARFPAARLLVLDGSAAMLRAAGELLAPHADRVELRQFRLDDPAWPDRLDGGVRCVLSSLAIHHLDGPEKRALFGRLHERLERGGALLIADIVEPTSVWARRQWARAWDADARRQSLEHTGDLSAYQHFLDERWNLFNFPDPDVDKPSPLPDQLEWLHEAGFIGVDVFWHRAGHAIYGGYRAE